MSEMHYISLAMYSLGKCAGKILSFSILYSIFFSDFVGENYVGLYNTMTSDMTQTFVDITTSNYVQNLAGTPFKMLIYNGIEILEHDFEILYFFN